MRAPALLKIFSGADPAALADAQIAFHRELAEFFEGLRDDRPDVGTHEGPWRAMDFGIAYHRAWTEMWDRMRGDPWRAGRAAAAVDG
jgi:hypothetical protein